MDLRPILKIERALYSKLRSVWQPLAAKVWAEVEDCLQVNDFAGAYEAASRLNAREVAHNVREYVKYYLLSAGYFGSKIANTRGKTTAVQAGSYEGMLSRLANQFTLAVEYGVTEAAYTKLVEMIAGAEKAAKVVKANPYHDKWGKFTTKDGAVNTGDALMKHKQWSPQYNEAFDVWSEVDDALNEHAGKVWAKLSPDQQIAIKRYTESAHARKVNHDSIDRPDRPTPVMRELDDSLSKTTIGVSVVTYRGLSPKTLGLTKEATERDAKRLIGKVIKDPVYGSTSMSKIFACTFLGGPGSTLLRIHNDAKDTGIYLGEGRSNHPIEEEVLLPRGISYLITGMKREVLFPKSGPEGKVWVLDVKKVSKSQKVKKKAEDHPRFITDFTSFADAGNKRLQMISYLHTSRLSGWGFTAEAEVLGIDSYRISAVLDGRTCEFCAMIGAKQFDLSTGREHLKEALSTDDPEKLAEIAPWPDQDKESISKYQDMGGDQLADLGFDVPPFHPHCRCLMVKVDSQIEGEQRGNAEDPFQVVKEPQSPEAFDAIGADVSDKDVEVWNDYVGVAPADALSKVTGIPVADLVDKPIGEGQFFKFDADNNLKMQAAGELAGPDSNVEVSKVFDPFTKTLYNNYAEFEAGSDQMAVDWLKTNYKQSVELAKTLGANELMVKADGEYGLFAHAKMGFLPASAGEWSNFQLALEEELAEGGRLRSVWLKMTPDEQGLLTSILNHQGEEGLWAIASMSHGEELLAHHALALAYDWANNDASSMFNAVFA